MSSSPRLSITLRPTSTEWLAEADCYIALRADLRKADYMVEIDPDPNARLNDDLVDVEMVLSGRPDDVELNSILEAALSQLRESVRRRNPQLPRQIANYDADGVPLREALIAVE